MSEEQPQSAYGTDEVPVARILGGIAFLAMCGLFFALGPGPVLACLLVGGLGWVLGTRSPESKSAMIGALGALMIWSAVSYAVWQLYLWNLGREMERAFNQ